MDKQIKDKYAMVVEFLKTKMPSHEETSNELKHMSRQELVELLYKMKLREEALLARIDELESQLDDRSIIKDEAGSIAEAALKLNDIFEVAQAAADDYLLSVKAQAKSSKK